MLVVVQMKHLTNRGQAWIIKIISSCVIPEQRWKMEVVWLIDEGSIFGIMRCSHPTPPPLLLPPHPPGSQGWIAGCHILCMKWKPEFPCSLYCSRKTIWQTYTNPSSITIRNLVWQYQSLQYGIPARRTTFQAKPVDLLTPSESDWQMSFASQRQHTNMLPYSGLQVVQLQVPLYK